LREKHGTTLTEAFRAINSPKKTGWEMPVEMSGHKALGFTAQKQIELSRAYALKTDHSPHLNTVRLFQYV